jgi:hypothetical protein
MVVWVIEMAVHWCRKMLVPLASERKWYPPYKYPVGVMAIMVLTDYACAGMFEGSLSSNNEGQFKYTELMVYWRLHLQGKLFGQHTE